jgi:hypothetical protein
MLTGVLVLEPLRPSGHVARQVAVGGAPLHRTGEMLKCKAKVADKFRKIPNQVA